MVSETPGSPIHQIRLFSKKSAFPLKKFSSRRKALFYLYFLQRVERQLFPKEVSYSRLQAWVAHMVQRRPFYWSEVPRQLVGLMSVVFLLKV